MALTASYIASWTIAIVRVDKPSVSLVVWMASSIVWFQAMITSPRVMFVSAVACWPPALASTLERRHADPDGHGELVIPLGIGRGGLRERAGVSLVELDRRARLRLARDRHIRARHHAVSVRVGDGSSPAVNISGWTVIAAPRFMRAKDRSFVLIVPAAGGVGGERVARLAHLHALQAPHELDVLSGHLVVAVDVADQGHVELRAAPWRPASPPGRRNCPA